MAYNGNHPLKDQLLGDRDVRRLLHRHAAVERKLGEAMTGPMVDWDGVRLLKVEKLRLNEELTRLQRLKQMH